MDVIKQCIEWSKNYIDICKDRGVILFGASKGGLYIKKVMERENINIKFFCDNDTAKTGKYIGNIEIVSTDALLQADKSSPIFISSQYVKDIANQLRALGFINIAADGLIFKISDNYDAILNTSKLLEDEESKKIYFGLINKRCRCETDIGVYKSGGIQYFDDEIIKLSENEIFIDGGGYNGDTVTQFIKSSKGKYNKIYCFEPNPGIYKWLTDNTREIKNLTLYEKGLYSRSERLRFSDNGWGSSINEEGEMTVDTVALDQILADEKITYIKLDVEGGELEGLKGAENIIKKHKPKLAVCVYHKPEDLWVLPLYINKLSAEYKLYIRHYSGDNHFETVLYCV